MSVLPPPGETWLVRLECQGSIPGPRVLDGHTLTGEVTLTDQTSLTGTRWAITCFAPSKYFLRCLGAFELPPPIPTQDSTNATLRILDGRTQDQKVALVRDHAQLLSGSAWEASEVTSGVITLRCLGHIPGNRFLDGDTVHNVVQLAPAPDDARTGARWRVHVLGKLVTLECKGRGPGGSRFLKGEGADKVTLEYSATDFVATLWQLNDVGEGAVTLACLSDTGDFRFLDGRTGGALDGTVGLAPSTDPPFSGTRWQLGVLDDGTNSLRCLGIEPGLNRFLDGVTDGGRAQLAPNTDEPYSGTHWRIRDAGRWWTPCRFPSVPTGGPFEIVSTTRLGQVTGSQDPQHRPLLNCDTTPWGVRGTDLGANADHTDGDGRLYIFFGDVVGEDPPRPLAPPHDADLVAWTTASSAEALVQHVPGAGDCAIQAVLDPYRTFFDPFGVTRTFFDPFTVSGPDGGEPIGPLLTNETPVGAFSFNGRMYVFVWIGPTHSPRVVPAGSHLVSKANPSVPGPYDYEFVMSALEGPKSSFSQVAPVVVHTAAVAELPQGSERGVVLFGLGKSVANNSDAVHLAYLPLTTERRPRRDDILYCAGHARLGSGLRWKPNEPDSAVPLFVLERSQYTSLSAAWLSGPKLWILVYGKGNDDDSIKAPIVARFAKTLFQWSNEVELFNPCRDGAYGSDGYAHWPGIDDIPRRVPPELGFGAGTAYGAFLIDRFTRWRPATRELDLYYLLSLFRPYQVQLMHTVVRIA